MPTPRVAGGPEPQEKECSSNSGALPRCYTVPAVFQIPTVAVVTSYHHRWEARDISHSDTQTRKGIKAGHLPKKAQTHSKL